jgi:VPDSG-CTERM motif
VSINGGAQTLGPISIVHGNSFLFSFALLASLSQVDLTVGKTMPIINASGEDRGAECRLANVPDGGATLSLLGVSLFGVGALRRRFNV